MSKKNHIECINSLLPVRDALDVISGKWKLQIIISIWAGNNRFREIERSIPKITTKVLANALKDLEENHLVKRTVYDESPVLIEYTLQPYAKSLETVIEALKDFGINHRKKVLGKE
ncbi:DNA-binding transcriptional regulator, HxlR family [Porphyromonadaceae bacterium KH3CP3RA]|nr:DNA-binding transcriptional regulator, HxlR family [Porphyromonadaceae bacterium KH3CP3RA]